MTRRRHAYPEHANWQDTGCDLYASCLACPRAVCRYDEPSQRIRQHTDLVVVLGESGLDTGTVAERAGVSRRSVQRILATRRTG